MLLRRDFAVAAGSRSGSEGGCGRGGRRMGGGLGPARRLGPAGSRAAEPLPLLLQLHAQAGELPLDLADRLLALVESLSLCLGEGELLHGLLLALLGRGDLAR